MKDIHSFISMKLERKYIFLKISEFQKISFFASNVSVFFFKKQEITKSFNDRKKGNRDCVASTVETLRFYMHNYLLNHRKYHDTNRKHCQGMICNKGFLLKLLVFFVFKIYGYWKELKS